MLTTLHADSVPRAFDRIREFYPAPEQANASALLARSLNAMICQRLIPSCAGKRIPCLEIMKRNVGTQDAVARNDLALLASNIEASVNEGMHSFDQYLMQLFKSGHVTLETARHYANNWSRVEMDMHGFAPSASGFLKPDWARGSDTATMEVPRKMSEARRFIAAADIPDCRWNRRLGATR